MNTMEWSRTAISVSNITYCLMFSVTPVILDESGFAGIVLIAKGMTSNMTVSPRLRQFMHSEGQVGVFH